MRPVRMSFENMHEDQYDYNYYNYNCIKEE